MPPPGTAVLEGVRILLVEDDRDTQFLTSTILTSAGAEVLGVDNGQRALDRLPDIRPDLLLSDIGMPILDGFQLIHRVRELDDPALRNVPAVALTAYHGRHHFATAVAHGFDLYLTKPIEPAELIHALSTLLRTYGARTP